MKLHIYNEIPEGLLDVAVTDLHSVLPGPSLIHLPGRREPDLFVSTLLHGNETTGFLAVQELLREYHQQQRELPRGLTVFLGNVAAAREGMRYLPGQPDYNRIWAGGELAEHKLAQQVLDIMRQRGMFVSIDLHNNTGFNPHYSCINVLDPIFINLASLFNRVIVYFTEPYEVQSMAFSKIGPAVTIESGVSGDAEGIAEVVSFVNACLHMDHLREKTTKLSHLLIYHTIARVRVPHGYKVSFDPQANHADFVFLENLDHLNFTQLSANTLLGYCHNSNAVLLVDKQCDLPSSECYFRYENGEIRLRKPVVPAMFTKNVKVIDQDCLGYLMEEIAIDDLARAFNAQRSAAA